MSLSSDKARQLADELRVISDKLYDYPYLNFALQLEGVHMRLLEEIWQQEERARASSHEVERLRAESTHD